VLLVAIQIFGGTANECFGLLKWWLDAGMPYTPEAMDKMFHRLVNPTIASAMKIAPGKTLISPVLEFQL